MRTLPELRSALEAAVEAMESALTDLENPQEGADELVLQRKFDEAREAHAAASAAYERADAVQEARNTIPSEAAPAAPAEHASDGSGMELRDGAVIEVGATALTYQRGGPHSIFSDMWLATDQGGGSATARDRLNQHRSEAAGAVREFATRIQRGKPGEQQQRAAITQTLGEGGELIAPVYLQEKWIGLPRAGRPIADSLNQQAWVHTNVINLPKIKTGTAVAVQTDTGSVESKAVTTELVTGAAQTIAGQEDVSQQLVDLAMPGVDEVIFDDLTRAYDTQLDIKLIEGSVTNAKGINALTGTNGVAFTEATPKQGKFFSKLAKAIAEINLNVFMAPSIIAMSPIRWAWMLAALDTQERPLIVPVGAPGFNTMGLETKIAAENIVGNMFGIPVIIDASIPRTKGASTNQDECYVYRADQLFLWESSPTLRIFPEVLSGKLEVRFQLYGYYNTILGRLPKAISVISGTGLAEPSF
jgi:HK97 family phage major capsid protein